MSSSWVDKWKKRVLSAPFEDEQVLRGLSRAPHHPPPELDSVVVDRLPDIGDERTFGLGRTPGPKAILYGLARDESLQQAGVRLPRSTRTIDRLLREQGRIAPRLPHLCEPTERPKPMQRWQLDFKDASSVPPEPEGKQQHVVETLNLIDMGTSVLLASYVRSDFTAETARPRRGAHVGFPGIARFHHAGSRYAVGRCTARLGLSRGLDPLLSLPRGSSPRLRAAASATTWLC